MGLGTRVNKALLICAGVFGASLCTGCAVPYFDVPTDNVGQPTVASIVNRIECEIRDMVRDDRGDNDVESFHRLFLLNGDYDVAIALSLDVNDTGGLTPSISSGLIGLGALNSVAINANGTLRKSRDHNFTENIQLSVRKIYVDWKTNADPHDCPMADTNLSGTLGIKDFVAMAALTPNLDEKQTLSGKGVFGGSVQFLVTKSLSATGPTWALVPFKSLAALGDLSEVNTDRITLAFAQGPNAGKPIGLKVARQPNPNAYFFLQQLITSSINTQLTTLGQTLAPNLVPFLLVPRFVP